MNGVWKFEIPDRLLSALQIGALAFLFTNAACRSVYARVMARDSPDGLCLMGVSIAMSVLQIIFVALRFYTRRLQREKYGWDDWVMLIALVCTLVLYYFVPERSG
jgi:hypothetical protein